MQESTVLLSFNISVAKSIFLLCIVLPVLPIISQITPVIKVTIYFPINNLFKNDIINKIFYDEKLFLVVG